MILILRIIAGLTGLGFIYIGDALIEAAKSDAGAPAAMAGLILIFFGLFKKS